MVKVVLSTSCCIAVTCISSPQTLSLHITATCRTTATCRADVGCAIGLPGEVAGAPADAGGVCPGAVHPCGVWPAGILACAVHKHYHHNPPAAIQLAQGFEAGGGVGSFSISLILFHFTISAPLAINSLTHNSHTHNNFALAASHQHSQRAQQPSTTRRRRRTPRTRPSR